MSRRGGKPLRILITDAHELVGVGTIRSLGRAGHRPVAAYPLYDNREQRPAASRSRWCADAIGYPDPWVDQWGFRDWLVQQLNSGRYDAVLPLAEAALFATAAIRDMIPAGILAVLPDDGSLKYTLSKFHATRAAMQAGLTVPETVFISDGGPERLSDEGLSALGYPLLFKADNYLSQDGVYVKGTTLAAPDPEAARDVLGEYRYTRIGIIAQQVVPGYGVGAFLLRWGSRTWLDFAHRRLHEVPWSGGYSSLRASIHDAALIEKARGLLDSIDYQGVAMVEFRRSPDASEEYFMEINGRLWGSLALALHAGVDFPAALIDCYQYGEPLPQHQNSRYPAGLRCRNTLPGEIYHLASVLKAKRRPGAPTPPAKLKTLLEFVMLTLNPTVKRDFFWLQDPRPWLTQASQTWHHLASRTASKLSALAAKQSKRSFLTQQKRRHELRRQEAVYFEPKPNRILFLCYGNICRSPFAEFYWRKLIAKHGERTPAAVSAGFYPRVGRRTPERFKFLTDGIGVELSEHRSKLVTRGMIDDADAVFVMDWRNWRGLARKFPDALSKTYLMGLFGNDGQVELDDPYLLAPSEARVCYERLAQAVEGLWRVLRPG